MPPALTRRAALRLLGGAGTLALAAPGRPASASPAPLPPATSHAATAASHGSRLPLTAQETAGPFPLLALLGNPLLQRQDMTEGRPGLPLRLFLTLEHPDHSAVAGAAVYVWHCDKDGVYSGYPEQTGDADSRGQSFLRAIQVSDHRGRVRFDTIYPGWYEGRITHVHVQVYLHDRLSVQAICTTQLAFPQAVTRAVYASPLYRAHGQNTSVTGFADDMVFCDGTSTEMLDISGDVTEGFMGRLVLVVG